MPGRTSLWTCWGAAALWLGCSDECPPGKQPHRISGNCVDEVSLPEGQRPDGGRLDASPLDGGGPGDVGGLGDGGGPGDGGSPSDAGPPPPPMPFAQFSYRERLRPLVGTVEVVADGLFVDESTATVQRSTQMIADADGRSCLLSVRRVTAGQPQPYALGTSRLVAGGQVLPLVSGADGSLRAAATPPIGFAVNGIEVALEVQGASGPLGLSPFRLPVAGPLQLSVLSPATLGPVDLLPPPQITWIPPTTVVSIVVEVATVDREVVLVCSVVNDGIYQLSSAAVDAYRLEAQGAPATLEVRTESVATVTASVDGQPIVPVTLHVATGVVFDAR